MDKHVVLLDNSSFAGVMRLLVPKLDKHEEFTRLYPAHQEVDRRSFKEFLTALCLFDSVQMDSICTGPRYPMDPGNDDLAPSPASWVGDMLARLPEDLAGAVGHYAPTPNAHLMDHEYACETAYDLFRSHVQDKIKLRPDEKLPDVYTSGRYVFRQEFEEINETNGNALTPELLAEAMFFHRGLYLQSRALSASYTYWPYLFRGRMLSSVSPLISLPPPTDGDQGPTASQVLGVRPTDDDHLSDLGKFYYQLMSELHWFSHEDGIPFVGEAIYVGALGDPKAAVDMALEIRTRGDLRMRWNALRHAIDKNDKLEFNRTMKSIRQDFVEAAAHLGLKPGGSTTSTVLKLASSVVPRGIVVAAEAAASVLPASIRDWGARTASHLLTKNSFHVMFIQHARALKMA